MEQKLLFQVKNEKGDLKFDYDKISSERDKLEAHLLQRVFEFEMLEKALRNINMELLKSTCELKGSYI